MSRLLLPRGYRNTQRLQKQIHVQPEQYFMRKGERRALRLFHEMATRVPAYKDFLAKNKINPRHIRSVQDFSKVPTLDKDNYLRKYPTEKLCWDGEFGHGRWVVSATSGSTGKPFYFPRGATQDWQYAVSAELYLRENFSIQDKSTLYIVAFPMGAWIGGLFTYEALRIVADHGGYDLSVITPGIHKQEVINAVKELGGDFDQIIIGAYAPFLKDILDDGKRLGVKWDNYDLGFVFSAEAFSEKFRDYVIDIVSPKDVNKFSLNHYGTVDQGTLAHETPESVLIRRELVKNNHLTALFPEEHRQPTFAQYNPEIFYFEQQDDRLLCSTYSGIPLFRYDLKDYGGVLSRQEVYTQLENNGFNVNQLLAESNLKDSSWNLPFVYIYERNDFSVSYYAFLLYPDPIKRALHEDDLKHKITGKFTMFVDYDRNGRQRLHINTERKHGVEGSKQLNELVQNIVHEKLIDESSEYRETAKSVGEVVKPIIKTWDYESPNHFKSGGKQKWVKK